MKVRECRESCVCVAVHNLSDAWKLCHVFMGGCRAGEGAILRFCDVRQNEQERPRRPGAAYSSHGRPIMHVLHMHPLHSHAPADPAQCSNSAACRLPAWGCAVYAALLRVRVPLAPATSPLCYQPWASDIGMHHTEAVAGSTPADVSSCQSLPGRLLVCKSPAASSPLDCLSAAGHVYVVPWQRYASCLPTPSLLWRRSGLFLNTVSAPIKVDSSLTPGKRLSSGAPQITLKTSGAVDVALYMYCNPSWLTAKNKGEAAGPRNAIFRSGAPPTLLPPTLS